MFWAVIEKNEIHFMSTELYKFYGRNLRELLHCTCFYNLLTWIVLGVLGTVMTFFTNISDGEVALVLFEAS